MQETERAQKYIHTYIGTYIVHAYIHTHTHIIHTYIRTRKYNGTLTQDKTNEKQNIKFYE